MRDILEVVGYILFILLFTGVLIFAIIIPVSCVQVSFFNDEMGTDYTATQWMFNYSTIKDMVVGEKIRLEDFR